jgi:hypothetical protein
MYYIRLITLNTPHSKAWFPLYFVNPTNVWCHNLQPYRGVGIKPSMCTVKYPTHWKDFSNGTCNLQQISILRYALNSLFW